MSNASRRRTRARSTPPRSRAHTHAPFQRAEQVVVLATMAACALVFWRAPLDAFGTPKLTVLLLGGVGILAAWGLGAANHGRLLLPSGWTLWAPIGFASAAVITTLLAGPGGTALFGAYTRYAGLFPYLCYVLIFLTVVRVADAAWVDQLHRVILVVTGIVAGYGLLQAAGVDPFEWVADLTPVFTTLGQENFASGFLAVMGTACLAGALDSRSSGRRRIAALLVTASAVIVIWQTGSSQGYLALAVGVAALVAGAVLPQTWQRLQRASSVSRWSAIAFAAATGIAGFAAILYTALSELVAEGSERRMLWRAASNMFRERPLLGWGFDGFSSHFPAHRPREHAVKLTSVAVDDPHSVPLNLLVSGGVLLLAAYLLFVGFVAWRLAKGLGHADHRRRTLLAGFGGAWLAYHAQSLVSFDVPPNALLHWVFAGAIVFLAAEACEQQLVPAVGRKRSRGHVPIAAYAFVAVIGVLLLVGLTKPLRADLAAASGKRLRDAGSMEAIEEFQRAADTAPWVPAYRTQLAAVLVDAGQLDRALEQGQRAARLATGYAPTMLAAGDLAKGLGNLQAAEHWYREAVARDPFNPLARRQLGKFLLETDDIDEAVQVLKASVRLMPSDPSYLLPLAEAYRAAGKPRLARSVYENVLEVEPTNPIALEALQLTS